MKIIKLLVTDETENALKELTEAWNEYIEACGGTEVIEMETALGMFANAWAIKEEAAKRRELTFCKKAMAA
jgi:hypothetical protein